MGNKVAKSKNINNILSRFDTTRIKFPLEIEIQGDDLNINTKFGLSLFEAQNYPHVHMMVLCPTDCSLFTSKFSDDNVGPADEVLERIELLLQRITMINEHKPPWLDASLEKTNILLFIYDCLNQKNLSILASCMRHYNLSLVWLASNQQEKIHKRSTDLFELDRDRYIFKNDNRTNNFSCTVIGKLEIIPKYCSIRDKHYSIDRCLECCAYISTILFSFYMPRDIHTIILSY